MFSLDDSSNEGHPMIAAWNTNLILLYLVAFILLLFLVTFISSRSLMPKYLNLLAESLNEMQPCCGAVICHNHTKLCYPKQSL